jgi:tetratricopeptide (TPR) repeat protein
MSLSNLSASAPHLFRPPRNGPCLCGSGLKFKRCCADRLRDEVDYDPRMRAFLQEGKFKDALYTCRAYVTHYTIWHKSHTEPAIRAGMAKKGSILEIDIRALAAIIDDLMFCHIKAEIMDEFPAVLERLRTNINDPDWQRKITYFHVLYALWPDWNRRAGRREMKKLGSIVDDKDEEILQLYLDLYSDSLSFSGEQGLIERILANTKSFTDRLHYKGAKAVLFLTIGDRKKAETELEEAVQEARERAYLTEYEQYRLAQTLSLLGALRANSNMLTEALELYQRLLEDGDWTPFGRASLLGLIGETYRRQQEWEKARQAYVKALEIHPLAIDKVFLAECFLQLEQLPDATRTLGEVQPSELSAGERVDYAFAFAAIAIEMGDRKRLEEATTVLKALQISDPLFREQRDALLLNVREAFTSGPSRPLIERSRRLFAGLARFVSTYFFLKPSFMGMGMDVGKILEDLSKREEKPPLGRR